MTDELSVNHRNMRKSSPQLEPALLHQSNARVIPFEKDAKQHAFAEARGFLDRVLHER